MQNGRIQEKILLRLEGNEKELAAEDLGEKWQQRTEWSNSRDSSINLYLIERDE